MKGQLAFEHDARPELEATVARLDIDFAKHVRPTAAMLWSRIKKSRILDIARATLGAAWASTRSKYKKADLASSMEEAFAAGAPPVGIGRSMHAAALAWTMPGFAAFDTGGAEDTDAAAAPAGDPPADTPDASGDAEAEPSDEATQHAASAAEGNEPASTPNGEGDGAAVPDTGANGATDDAGANGNGHEPSVRCGGRVGS